MILDVRELVRRRPAGATDRTVTWDLGLARKTVAKYRGLARRAELLESPRPGLGQVEIPM